MKNIAIIFGFLVFFILSASGNIDSIDATTHLYLAKQIVNNHRIDFGHDAMAKHMVSNANQRNNNYYPIYNFGYALLLIPGVVLSNVLHSYYHVTPSSFPSKPDYIMTWYINIFNGFVLLLIYFTLKKLLYDLFALKQIKHLDLFMLAAFFSSNLIIQAHQEFVHLLFTLLACLAYEQLVHFVRTKKTICIVLFSLLFTCIAASYNTTFLFLIPAFTLLYLLLSKNIWHQKKEFVFYILSYLPALIVQLIWNYVRFGNMFLTGYHGRVEGIYIFNIVEICKHLIGMTVMGNKGLFVYSPFLIISFWFVFSQYKSNNKNIKAFCLFYITLALTYFLAYSPVIFWHGDSAYGPRYLTPLVVFGVIPFILFMNQLTNKAIALFVACIFVFGILVQIPGILIPHFTYRFITKTVCTSSERWYYDPRCSQILVGWAQLLKRETKETPFIFQNGPLIVDRYPNPLKPFKTIYPDPLFDARSQYKTRDYKPSEELLNNIYAFTLDLWWIKLHYYKNILP